MDLLLIIIVAGVVLMALSRPAAQQYIVVPVQPAQARGSGCAPLIAVLIAVLIIVALASAT